MDGAVLGVAVLGTVIGTAPSVGDGTLLALMVAGVRLLVGAGVVASFIGRCQRQPGTATAK